MDFPTPSQLGNTSANQNWKATIGDKFGESLGGSQAPQSFWKVPGLPRKFSATSPEVLSLWNWIAIQRFPGSFPDFPGSFPDFPGGSPEVTRFSGKPDTLFWLTKTFSDTKARRSCLTFSDTSTNFRIVLSPGQENKQILLHESANENNREAQEWDNTGTT